MKYYVGVIIDPIDDIIVEEDCTEYGTHAQAWDAALKLLGFYEAEHGGGFQADVKVYED